MYDSCIDTEKVLIFNLFFFKPHDFKYIFAVFQLTFYRTVKRFSFSAKNALQICKITKTNSEDC